LRRDLDKDVWQALLDSFSVDPSEAARFYEQQRIRLIRHFARESCPAPEELADECFNRAGRKLAAGEIVPDVARLLSGIARMLVLEDRRSPQRRIIPLTEAVEIQLRPARPPEPGREQALRCMDRCLSTIPSAHRDFLYRYYVGDAGERIRNRQRMAAELGLTLNALRNRALRARERLERCVQDCLTADRDVSAFGGTEE
jgi:DNA-directed RNA polymerase specialized sigma24 family protein